MLLRVFFVWSTCYVTARRNSKFTLAVCQLLFVDKSTPAPYKQLIHDLKRNRQTNNRRIENNSKKQPTNHNNFHVLMTNHITTKLTNPNNDQRHKYHRLTTTLHLTLKMTIYLYCLTDCATPLGMQNRTINDSQCTASSSYSNFTGPERARLNTWGKYISMMVYLLAGWRAETNDDKQWLQVTLEKLLTVTRIATQGGTFYKNQLHNGWVKSFSLAYSLEDQSNFYDYQDNKVTLRGFPEIANRNTETFKSNNLLT